MLGSYNLPLQENQSGVALKWHGLSAVEQFAFG